MTYRPWTSTALILIAACGGGGASGSTKTPGTDSSKKDEPSIGELAAAQGGLAALGGAGNREEGSTGIEVAMGGALRAEEVDKKSPVKLDGVLKEWPERSAASETLSGTTSALSFSVGVQYDDAKLYIAAEVTDPQLARTAAHGENEDHVSMTLAFPSGRGALKAYEIGLWAGKPGETSGAVKWLAGPSKGQEVSGAKLVESDATKGFVFEAAIPWSTFAEARTTRVGLRAAFRYHDVDAGGAHGVIGTGPGSADKPQDLPALPTEPEQAVVDNLLATRNLSSTAPSIDIFADVAGDERKERISVFGKFFTICGPGYRGGKQFFWRALTGKMIALETRDFTGHGKDDMLVRRRVTVGDVRHEVFELWTIEKGDEPTTLLAQEIAIYTKDEKKKISDAVRVSQKELEVSVEPPIGWDASSFTEQVANDVQPILLPWGPVKSRTFKLDKGKLVVASEVAQTPAASTATAATTAAPEVPKDVPTPQVTKGADTSRQVLDAYYKDQGLPTNTKARIDFDVHVDGDARPERVLLVGRDIVVLGPGFKNGTGYTRLTLSQFASEKDVSEMTARDLDGDGAAELVVRGIRHVKPTTGDDVQVDALFVYQVKNGAIARIFAIETGREQSGKRIQGLVQFVPAKGGKGFDIDVRPGMAKGWTKETYPWPEEKPGGAIEPLLLPWSGTKSLRYAWNGSAFALAN